MQEELHLIDGPTGMLEVKIAAPLQWRAGLPFIVCAHPHPLHGGTLNNKVVHTLAKAFYEAGLLSVRFNFRGVGQSQGQYDQGVGEQQDLVAVVDWLRQQYPASPCWLAGFSFGGYIAAAVSARVAAQFLALVAPAVHMFDVTQLRIAKIPWLVLMGRQDEVVPPALVQSWLAHQHNPAAEIWFDDVGHFFHGKLHLLREACLAAVEKLLRLSIRP